MAATVTTAMLLSSAGMLTNKSHVTGSALSPTNNLSDNVTVNEISPYPLLANYKSFLADFINYEKDSNDYSALSFNNLSFKWMVGSNGELTKREHEVYLTDEKYSYYTLKALYNDSTTNDITSHKIRVSEEHFDKFCEDFGLETKFEKSKFKLNEDTIINFDQTQLKALQTLLENATQLNLTPPITKEQAAEQLTDKLANLITIGIKSQAETTPTDFQPEFEKAVWKLREDKSPDTFSNPELGIHDYYLLDIEYSLDDNKDELQNLLVPVSPENFTDLSWAFGMTDKSANFFEFSNEQLKEMNETKIRAINIFLRETNKLYDNILSQENTPEM